MNISTISRLSVVFVLFFFLEGAHAFQQSPDKTELPNFDKRRSQTQSAWLKNHADGKKQLEKKLPNVQVDFDEVTGSLKSISARDGFLTGKKAGGRGVAPATASQFAPNEPHRATKAFLKEHAPLLGHGPEVLAEAKIKRDFVTAHNGLRTVIWEQELNGIPIFDGLLISHTTKHEELVRISSRFLPNAAQVAQRSARNPKERLNEPEISAASAIAIAAANLGDTVNISELTALDFTDGKASKRQSFKTRSLKGKTEAHLVWLPMSANHVRLCWQIILTSAVRGEMFKLLVDAQTGETLLRHGLTEHISDATYNVFVGDSPSPFSPGHSTPQSGQPSIVSRTLVVTNAYNTNASPNGWINDGVNETIGNNVEAQLDLNFDNQPDLPRPQGSPDRVFDFPIDFAQSPSTYRDASVVQLFFLCNWYHDKLYELGFTEAAGNFQMDNFGRGGLGGDPVQADAQDGFDSNNAQFSTPPDGSSGRMEMFIFTGPNPDRDGSFDAEIVFHEFTHGLSNRRVGGGTGLSASQSRGMGEGWSDFYALSLLAEPGDFLQGNYPAGGYVTFQFGGLTENYYYGIRRYPYSTDLNKNPLTFKDIDPNQAISHVGVPRNPVIGNSASEVHNQGEVWCSALWEIRANLITKYGFATGNQLTLQLVTDGMNLSPSNPNFVQARDAILQADQINNGGANYLELWTGFAKRGLGAFATSPSSSTTMGVEESFLLPDDLIVTPPENFIASGPVGGPFKPVFHSLTLTNIGTNSLNWEVSMPENWLTLSQTNGTLLAGGPETIVTATINSAATLLPMGIYTNSAFFTNVTSGIVHRRRTVLKIGQPDFFTRFFSGTGSNLSNQTFTFTPNGSSSFYSVCRSATTNFPSDTSDGFNLTLLDDSFAVATLPMGTAVKIYNASNNVFYIGSNGYLTLNSGDTTWTTSFDAHFDRPRVSGCFIDLDPTAGGAVTWKQLSNRVAVTYSNIREYDSIKADNFQIELFFDGVIRITYLKMDSSDQLIGLSAGAGIPSNFTETDFTLFNPCPIAVVLSAELANDVLVLEFDTVEGAVYQIQYSDDFTEWTPVTPLISGTGSAVQWTDDIAIPPSEGARFFRVLSL